MQLVEQCCKDLVGEERVAFDYDAWWTASSDFGDLTCVMPGVQFFGKGATGVLHGINFCVNDPERFCLNAAKAQLLAAEALLKEDAKNAREIAENYKPLYPSIKAYLAELDTLILDKDAVIYDEDGRAIVDYMN